MMQFIIIMKLESVSNKRNTIIINKIKLIIRLIEYQKIQIKCNKTSVKFHVKSQMINEILDYFQNSLLKYCSRFV